MENLLYCLPPALLGVIAAQTMLLPLRWFWKVTVHSGCGFLCLWMLNTLAPFTGMVFPMNALTVAIAGILGLPGIGLLALLAI